MLSPCKSLISFTLYYAHLHLLQDLFTSVQDTKHGLIVCSGNLLSQKSSHTAVKCILLTELKAAIVAVLLLLFVVVVAVLRCTFYESRTADFFFCLLFVALTPTVFFIQ